jgi:hypothetical protein
MNKLFLKLGIGIIVVFGLLTLGFYLWTPLTIKYCIWRMGSANARTRDAVVEKLIAMEDETERFIPRMLKYWKDGSEYEKKSAASYLWGKWYGSSAYIKNVLRNSVVQALEDAEGKFASELCEFLDGLYTIAQSCSNTNSPRKMYHDVKLFFRNKRKCIAHYVRYLICDKSYNDDSATYLDTDDAIKIIELGNFSYCVPALEHNAESSNPEQARMKSPVKYLCPPGVKIF